MHGCCQLAVVLHVDGFLIAWRAVAPVDFEVSCMLKTPLGYEIVMVKVACHGSNCQLQQVWRDEGRMFDED